MPFLEIISDTAHIPKKMPVIMETKWLRFDKNDKIQNGRFSSSFWCEESICDDILLFECDNRVKVDIKCIFDNTT